MSENAISTIFRKLTYTKAYMIAYIITVVLGILALAVLFSQTERSDVTRVSSENFQEKFGEREVYLHDFFEPYKTSIRAYAQNELLQSYLDTDAGYEGLSGLLMSVKQSLPCAYQVRFIAPDGMEKVRIEGTPVKTSGEFAVSRIVPAEALRNRAEQAYVHRFLNLPEGRMGISDIGLYSEAVMPEMTRKPVVHFGMGVFDAAGTQRGVLVYTICLKTMFQQLDSTTLYHVHLVDERGRFLLNNHSNHGGISGDRFETHTVVEEFGPEDAQRIMSKNEYEGERFYMRRIADFPNGQNLKMILDLKFEELSRHDSALKQKFLVLLIAVAIALLPAIYMFGNVPESLKRRLKNDAFKDEQTALPNRRALFRDLQERSFGESIIVLVHLSNYLKVQNIYGHELTSRLIAMVADFLVHYKHDSLLSVYRYGNDEFALRFEYTDALGLRRFLDELHRRLENHAFVIDDEAEVLLDITMGVSDPRRLNNGMDELKEAEVALEHAIAERQDFSIFNFDHLYDVERNRESMGVAKSIKRAIEEGNVVPYFQPILNNKTGIIEKYEALMRIHDNKTVLQPGVFLPIAKELKKYRHLTRLMMLKSFERFRKSPHDFSINLCTEDVMDESFQRDFFETIVEYGIAGRLIVEIVESESIRDYESFLRFIQRAKAAGVRFALDDFGSGYSNFQHVTAMVDYIDYIKIDGSIVLNALSDKKTQVLIESIVLFCDKLGIQTVAEYVEDARVFDFVKTLGIDYSQGYYIGKPDRALRLLRKAS